MFSFLIEDIINYTKLVVRDPEIDSWLLMRSPFPVLAVLSLYLAFVLNIGPKLMEKRQPFKLKSVLIVYNILQVTFNAWIFLYGFRIENFVYLLLTGCNVLSGNIKLATVLATGSWYYNMSKMMDLLDTIFFVLRKKQAQISFLHLYHHVSAVTMAWLYLKLLPGEVGVFMAVLNAGVHVFVYSYYLASVLKPQNKLLLWFKQYVTLLQIIQFYSITAYLGKFLVIECNQPKVLTISLMLFTLYNIYIFTSFYKKTYKKVKTQ